MNLSPPRKLDGSRPDATGGRGYVDEDGKTRLSRTALRLEIALSRAIEAIDKFADENFTFNRIPLTAEEEADLFMQMGQSDLEQLAGIYGPERIVAARREVAKTLARRRLPATSDGGLF